MRYVSLRYRIIIQCPSYSFFFFSLFTSEDDFYFELALYQKERIKALFINEIYVKRYILHFEFFIIYRINYKTRNVCVCVGGTNNTKKVI